MTAYGDYSHSEENLRVVDAGKSKYKIIRDAYGTGLWSIEVDTGSLPVPLRNQRYTSHRFALIAIKDYLDGHATRSIVYSKKKTED